MLFNNLRKNKNKRKQLAHILAGFVILMHAYEQYDEGHETYLYFAIAGFIFLSVAIFHQVIEKKAPWIDGVFFVIEAILSFIIAADYFHLGKKAIPFCYLLAGTAQLVMAFVKTKKGIAHHKSVSDLPNQ